jgi:protein-L-isoaspartate(D-aspartate) O-methyltransferase
MGRVSAKPALGPVSPRPRVVPLDLPEKQMAQPPMAMVQQQKMMSDIVAHALARQLPDDLVNQRLAMVAQLQAGGVHDPVVLQAMATVPRHRFVDSALVTQSYEDTSLPIGLAQTISKPSVVARMVALLREGWLAQQHRTERLDCVLEIGTGCGYQAAVLAQLAAQVYSIERLRGLHDKAVVNMRPLQLSHVHLLFGDGMLGFAQGAPYAAIISAAGGDDLPRAWLDQLAVGGRLVAPTVTAHGQQALVVVDRLASGYQRTVLEAVKFVPLKSGVG